MPVATTESVVVPFTAFNFSVEIFVPGLFLQVCRAAFAECDGLEMSMDMKTIREGGNNTRQVRLSGPVNYGTLSLKRGMSYNYDLWKWFGAIYEPEWANVRASASVVMYTPDRKSHTAEFKLGGCLPLKLKAPPLNAKDGLVAIEEFQLAYETLQLVPPA